MSHQWTLAERHALHIMATHYPQSTWADRGTIFNDVFSVNLSHEKIRDEYGGHKNGMRNPPSGIAPTRSLMWNDHVCRDEFNLPGPYDQQQAQDRHQLLQRIQASITRLGLARNQGLMAINMIPGRIRADNNSPALAAPAAPTAAPAATPARNTTAPTGAGASSSSAAAASSSTDPAQGGRPFYHTQEIVKEGNDFVYRPKEGLSFAVTPSKTYRRLVKFSSTLTMTVQVCDQAVCIVCRHGRAPRDQ
ncbi:hypothetical protein MBLNU13_g05210t1 [Cladosporium sp. NU13]